MIEDKSLHETILREDELEGWLESRAVTLRYEGLPFVEIGHGRSTRRFYFADDIVEFFRKRRTVIDTKADG